MAYLSKINLSGTIYSLKDTEVRAAVAALETAVASSLIFKGVIASATELTSLTNYKVGWTYKVSEIFTIADLGVVEPGDMIVCVNANTAYNAQDWTIIQNNIDVMSGASENSAGTRGLVPAPGITDNAKFLRGDGTWQQVEQVTWGTFSELTI